MPARTQEARARQVRVEMEGLFARLGDALCLSSVGLVLFSVACACVCVFASRDADVRDACVRSRRRTSGRSLECDARASRAGIGLLELC